MSKGWIGTPNTILSPLAIALIAAASPVCAQRTEATGSRILVPKPADIPANGSPEDKARATTVAFGRCVVLTNRRGAERAVSAFPTVGNRESPLSQTATDECLRYGQLRMPRAIYRGAIYQGLYAEDYGRKTPSDKSEKPIDFLLNAPAERDDQVMQAVAVRMFIDCTVRADPVDARGIVLSPVASLAERTAYQGLTPHMSKCLTKGLDLKFSKSILGGLIAEVLYRNAKGS